ncbi:MAG: molybdenum ABC transporter ATP-binding protein [Rhodospirillaceae bacterium]|jgi:molybdate transport system ATP-binding protein|nr:molybdenum ABC transporter ATP-binding protein [Rhodospirillaceae bacterium]MBT5373842.1 molybdenum ABC transporter ATP-binding protein [Rhodospirillaceae bacterium]MBT5752472.1 molybdenum ABC transporter ATP-binding protein [Rhodospirillaceae bacterium]
MLEIDVRKHLPGLDLDITFNVEKTGITTLFGRSGSGKTTLANLVAGLDRPDEGRIIADGTVLFDKRQKINLPPEQRGIGYVFQEGRLFPHLSVEGNLRYGQKRASEARAGGVSFDHVVGLLGIGHILTRRPRDLSGGEKQRVSIGRALLAGSRLLLMDEPLASLDQPRKNEILPFIEGLRDELSVPVIYISHSMDEVVRLTDTLVVLDRGRSVAAGPLEEIMSRLDLSPLTGRFEAGSVITTQVEGDVEGHPLTLLRFPGGILTVPRIKADKGEIVRVRIRARDILLATQPPVGLSAQNIFKGRIINVSKGENGLAEILVDVGIPLWARVTAKSCLDLGLDVGKEVHLILKTVAIDGASLGGRRRMDQ